ncbi:hypothetical protein TcasGA2_TC033385 [Tribolium castaneum]|uniref:DNA/RNA non-specific endonuclease domain-containing protein n=1 Tax=Tribolium castaneum TaxID=7070 RepID=A0A139WGE4_TRICA|nr:PREDICTED: uncharacterized protein LOC103313381 [Tribolium castaneum]KYB27060.1 hypothetical protein TcasGA2_TC033385 [Tribolium castaneum]|eukprot:XP_008194694.1 PREDICTED: uncharacterized protein LOC103313381 [Tribolium castaneum]
MLLLRLILFLMLILNFSTGCNPSRCRVARATPDDDSEIIARESGRTCNKGKGVKIAIGIQTVHCNVLSFTRKIDVCVNNKRNPQQTYWVKHKLEKGTTRCPSQSWKSDFLQGNVNEFYKNHRNFEGDTYDKGHLAPKCDFETELEQRMTFYYINAAPQWAPVNQRIWKYFEQGVRRQATGNQRYIITGTVGSRNNDVINIPKYFFKIVLPERVVYIGVNYNNALNENVKLCQPLNTCDYISPTTQMYCCDLDNDLLEELGLEQRDLFNDLDY